MTDKRKMHQAKSNKRKNESVNKGEQRDEFRRKIKGDNKAHPKYVFYKEGHEYKFIGITHSPITQGTKNIKLDKNPNPEDKRISYIRPKPECGSIREFDKKTVKGWKFADSDKAKVEAVKKEKVKTKKSKRKKSGSTSKN